MNKTYYPSLDGLRGLAAYIVMLGHFANYTGFWSEYFARGTGQLGVMLFFSLSGFLMGSIYIGSSISYKDVFNYYIRRISRVFPLYIFVVLISYLFYSEDYELFLFNINNSNILDHILFIKGDHVLWTVAVEVQFYVLFPAIWFVRKHSERLFYILIILAFFAIFFINGEPRTLIGHSHYFLLGLFIGVIPAKIYKYRNIIFTISFIIFILSVPGWPIQYEFESVKKMWFEIIFIVAVGFVLYGAIISNMAEYFLGSAIPSFIGRISYSIYIWHIPILLIFIEYTNIGMASRSGFIIYFISVNIVSIISYIVIERPSRNYINRRFGD